MYEVTTLDKVKNPQKSTISWDPDFSVYTWYAEQDEANNQTIIYANFHEKDPNKENVEISVRRNCFYPESEGIGYITLSGFRISQAATQWAPPTAYQEGMVGPHWSKGWIIEDCEIYESKCSGISLGKYLQPENDNKWLKWKYKDGTQTERDCICQASYEGWDKEHIGSHIVRRCEIHDCGQTGIVGHLGGVFSVIEDNHIHHIITSRIWQEQRLAVSKCMLLSMLFSAATISTTAPVVCGLTGRHREPALQEISSMTMLFLMTSRQGMTLSQA